ncbi:uncharacterized protein si:dkey-79d12.4 [Triplophysa dalaica]|uniref:uncharacterized protein si:dkey-79d12.4 n=1 Tax=Triplophysa dalaica TaxID=1582913 RepID=UPI0024E03810|nr:uncharacterized protein si:dkey-79d12.4 [Triplophysa dalaica]XP_056618217.1 uncharacterized protein si:dkey-79d12.4 [Triplophysa dalaica]XP_056618218.1 uncharacterized protein si:dkey-79d12.4 [Triplophysa dalaica]XP_056618219.1 uncharacterized protein si:dkey-79d12.4 [Triplophysa dalaica]
MHHAVDCRIQHNGCGNNAISACYGISEGSSDEDDYNVPVDCEDCMCCVCGEHFSFLDQLMEHLKTHKGQLFCHLCTADFDRAVSLALHLKNAHPKYHLCCTVCHVSFKSTWHLNEHLEKNYQEATKHEEKMNAKPLVKIKETENGVVEKYVMGNSRDNVFLLDHSYCVPVRHTVSMESSRKWKLIKEWQPQVIKEQQPRIHSPSTSCSSSGLCSDDDPSSEFSSSTSHQLQPHFDEEYVIPGDGESTDSDEDDSDALPPTDTEYCPDEDRSSDSQSSTGSNTLDSKSNLCNHHRKTEIKKEIDSEIKSSFANHSVNPASSTCGAKMDFQTDSPKSKVAIKEEIVDGCEEKPFVCCMCNAACRNKEVMLKHIGEKHPTAVYICSRCLDAFTQQNTFQKHVCWKRPTSQMKILLATKVPQLPVLNLSHDDDQRTTSAPVLSPKSVDIQMIPQLLPQSLTNAVAPLNSTNTSQKITSVIPTVIPVSQTVTTPPQTTIPTQTMPVGNVSPSGPAKLTESHPQAITVPQTPVKPPSVSVACPYVPVCSPPIQRPSPPNQTRMTLRIPTPFNPSPQTQNRVIVSFSPTVNRSAPILAPANSNKSIPAPRQTFAGNIRPLHLVGPVHLPGNVRPVLLPGNARPFQLSGNVRPVQLSGNVRPVQLSGNVRPVQLSGNVRPAQLPANVRPVQLSGNVRPAQLPENVRPVQLSGNVRPVQLSGNVRPVQLSGNVRPVQLPANVRPVQLPGSVKPVQLSGNVRPVQLSGNVRPVQLSANVRPVQLSGNVRPAQLPGNVRPVQLSGNIRPVQLSGNVRPVELSGNVRPVQLSGNVGPVQLPGSVKPVQVLGNARPLLQFLGNVQPYQFPANISPILIPGNASVPLASCPTLVSAILRKNPAHTSPAPGLPQTGGMFENKSSDIALQKRLKQTWSSKPIFPCRQCGAISRQPSLRVRHRYLHRGSRLYRCQCGRSFQWQIHLLRHQVQHAEAVRFVCACCGRTFDGAHKLTQHKQSRLIHRQYSKTKCIEAFECTCGRVFKRPSVLLWHVLKNTKPRQNTLIEPVTAV